LLRIQCIISYVGRWRYARLELGPQDTAQAILQLKVLDHRAEPVASDLGVQRVDDRLDVLPRQRVVQFVVLQALQHHNRRYLTLRDELLAEIQQRLQVRRWQVVRLVRVLIPFRHVFDMAGRRTRRHERMAGEEHLILYVFSCLTTEILGVVAAWSFQSVSN
ncbi:hypothetical protein T310_8820, partial [Rasamsonia emersonii CBS 393.64]